MFTKSQLSQLFDDIYQEADTILRDHDPCQFNKLFPKTCKRGVNYTYALNNATIEDTVKTIQDNSFCCDGCEFLGESGCRVKCIACKLWLCEMDCKSFNKFRERVAHLSERATLFHFMGFRKSKEQTIKDSLNYWNAKKLTMTAEESVKLINAILKRNLNQKEK